MLKGDGRLQQWLSLEDGQSGAPPLEEGRGSRTGLISVSQTLFCSLFACFCIPIIGWVPLAFACKYYDQGQLLIQPDLFNQQVIAQSDLGRSQFSSFSKCDNHKMRLRLLIYCKTIEQSTMYN